MSNQSQHDDSNEVDAVIGDVLRQAESAIVVDREDLARRREALLGWMTNRIEADRESGTEDPEAGVAQRADRVRKAGGFGRKLLLAVEADAYGRSDALTQHEFQEAITRLLGEAADTAQLDRSRWMTQVGGDSLFTVLPESVSEAALVDTFMRVLDARLRAFNHDRVRQARLRLRAAVHFGSVASDANGFVGRAPLEIGRILHCGALRTALAQSPDACLAVGVSATVFHDVVREAYTTLRADEFRRVDVEAKEYRGEAWIWVPGADVRQLDLRPSPEEITPTVSMRSSGSVQVNTTSGSAQVHQGGVETGRR
ncbi:hypothetical protein N4G69_45980 [Streptomyces mirabilis]|uniref:hypothetical protein n=1 Tax=Streptomyces mirabilis TaxID=68239 RepID=UPI0021C22690|nr:hypothetical protein [Streptomyces mirabilis]MCT9112817.1 hypothetical protein [Streptomyces mirabilis]